MIHAGDCFEVMPTLDACSIDAVVTDPPYGLEFMGKAWDRLSDQPGYVEAGRITTRAPGPRTGAGGRGVNSYQAGTPMQEWHGRWAAEALRVAKPGAYLLAFGGTRTYHRLAAAIEDAGWEIRDCLVWAYASGFPKSLNLDGDRAGWGTGLKPAWEPIVLARKPLDGTVAGNVAKHGTGALNIDGTRIPAEGAELGRWPANVMLTDAIFDGGVPGVVGGGEQSGGGNPKWRSTEAPDGSYHGRFAGGETGLTPVDTSGTYSRFFLVPKAARSDREPILAGQLEAKRPPSWSSGEQSPGTFQSQPTPARENVHPTVKPVELMRHLVRLVTPPGGTVLDPFLGSGSTALACEAEGFAWIGIEREAEYVAIAEARLTGTQRGFGLG